MVIEICTCGHPDTLHVVDTEDDAAKTPTGQGACYVPSCHCVSFTETVQLVQLVSHREHHDEKAILLGLDSRGRVWWWYDPDCEWLLQDGTFVFSKEARP